MSSAVLRGFDYLATELDDRIRFCHPILSFGPGDSAQMYLARTMDWEYDAEHGSRWLTPISAAQVEYFGTLTSERLTVKRGQGVVVIGQRFAAEAREIAICMEDTWGVKVAQVADATCLIGITDVKSLERHVQEMTERARSVFDDELPTTNIKGLSRLAESALFVLVNCSTTSHLCVAQYELAAAIARNDREAYLRLLPMFALELNESQDDLDSWVCQYVRIHGGELIGRWTMVGRLAEGKVLSRAGSGVVLGLVDSVKKMAHAVNELEDAGRDKYGFTDLGEDVAGLFQATLGWKGDNDTVWSIRLGETGDLAIGTTSRIIAGEPLELGQDFGLGRDRLIRGWKDDVMRATHGTRQEEAMMNYFRKRPPLKSGGFVGSPYA